MRIFTLIVTLFVFSIAGHAVENFAVKLDLKKSSANTLYVDALLSDAVATEFMIDTGSSVVVINQKTFDLLRDSGSEITATTQMGARLASGRIKLVQQYQITSLSLGGVCQFDNVEVAVMTKSNNILGMSLLSAAAPFAVYAKPTQLALSHCGQPADAFAQLSTN